MSLKFSLVHRKDMTKGAPADRKLYYGLTRVSSRLDLEKLCDAIASRSTASRGDIKLELEEKVIVLAALGVIVTFSQRPPSDNSTPPGNTELPVNPIPKANRVTPDSTVKGTGSALCPTKGYTEPPLQLVPPTC